MTNTVQKPETILQGKNRPFTGQEFIDSLNDGRNVWLHGQKVDVVAEHPAFRNAAQSIARMYDALHTDRASGADVMTCDTDTGNGGFTHKFFRRNQNKQDIVGQRDAIAAWAKMSYGWMGRSPDYKASLVNAMGAGADFFGDCAKHAEGWYKRAQENVLHMNHVIVNPPVDRNLPASACKDVFITIDKETDAGIFVSGAKVVATGAVISQYSFVGQTAAMPIDDDSMAVVFMANMAHPGVKLICRASYEENVAKVSTAFDYPLSSRFDENDSIIVFDNAFIPWEDVLIHRDIDAVRNFYIHTGYVQAFCLQGCTRLAVKLDFIAGLLSKCLQAAGTYEFRGVKAQLGEVIAWRNTLWALSDAMVHNPDLRRDTYLPNARSAAAYRVQAPDAYVKIKSIIESTLTSSLIYLNGSADDYKNPEIDAYVNQFVRGANGISAHERIKVMKLMWDAMGSEFGGRHELYERNYAGSFEEIRLQCLFGAMGSGEMAKMDALVDECLSDYDEGGFKSHTVWHQSGGNHWGRKSDVVFDAGARASGTLSHSP